MPDLPRAELDSYQPPEPSADLVDRIMTAVHEQERGAPEAPGRSRGQVVRWLAVAAAVTVVLGAILIWRYSGQQEGWRTVHAAAKQTVALGSRATVVIESSASLRWRTDGDDSVAVEQTRGTAIYSVNKGGPFIVSVPGGRVQVVGTRFKVEVNPMNSRPKSSRLKRGAVGAAALAVAVVVVYEGRVLLGNSDGEVALAAGEEGALSPGEPPRRAPRAARVQAPADRPPARTGWARRFPNVEARRELLRIIRAARTRRERSFQTDRTAPTATSPGHATGQNEPKGVLPKEYIRSTIKEAIPLVKECYELALHKSPTLSGKLIAKFTILGDEEAGGLVEIVDIEGDDSVARHPTLSECIRETIYSLEFPKPEGGGRVEVRYPFNMRTSGKKNPQ